MRVDYDDIASRYAVRRVLCNGFVQKFVTMADEELGAVERIKTDKKGNALHINGTLCREEINGRVKIELNHGWTMNDKNEYFLNGSPFRKEDFL